MFGFDVFPWNEFILTKGWMMLLSHHKVNYILDPTLVIKYVYSNNDFIINKDVYIYAYTYISHISRTFGKLANK